MTELTDNVGIGFVRTIYPPGRVPLPGPRTTTLKGTINEDTTGPTMLWDDSGTKLATVIAGNQLGLILPTSTHSRRC